MGKPKENCPAYFFFLAAHGRMGEFSSICINRIDFIFTPLILEFNCCHVIQSKSVLDVFILHLCLFFDNWTQVRLTQDSDSIVTLPKIN